VVAYASRNRFFTAVLVNRAPYMPVFEGLASRFFKLANAMHAQQHRADSISVNQL
jgi:hypothetical protein